jgi:hypothetical protein
MSLFVGQGKCIQRHKTNVQLYSAMKRQSRYLRAIDNPKFWKDQLSILHTTLQIMAFLEYFKLCAPPFSIHSLISLNI